MRSSILSIVSACENFSAPRFSLACSQPSRKSEDNARPACSSLKSAQHSSSQRRRAREVQAMSSIKVTVPGATLLKRLSKLWQRSCATRTVTRRVRAVAVLAAAALPLLGTLSAQTHTRRLETPSRRLIGHWVITDVAYEFSSGDVPVSNPHSTEWYIGPRPQRVTDLGSITILIDGAVSQVRYQVLEEEPNGERVLIDRVQLDGRRQRYAFWLAKDGQSLILRDPIGIRREGRYLDSRTRPASN